MLALESSCLLPWESSYFPEWFYYSLWRLSSLGTAFESDIADEQELRARRRDSTQLRT